MPEWWPQRQVTRYPIVLPFQYRVQGAPPDRTGVGWTWTLSSAGAGLELGEPVSPQAILQVRLQTERGTIEAEGKVIWGGSPLPTGSIQHGMAFTRLAPDHVQALQAVLRSIESSRRPRDRVPFDVAAACRPTWPAGPALEGRTENISRRGGLFRLPEIVMPSTVLEITLDPPGGPLRLEGTIAWVGPAKSWTPGTMVRQGVLFAPPDWQTSVSLARMLTAATGGSSW